MENNNGTNSTQSGDINLVSALMACAIPLIADNPLTLISSEHGGVYARFSLEVASQDGRHTSETCVSHWSGVVALPDNHPFSQICKFIRARPRSSMNESDWLDYAVDYMKERGIELPGLRNMSDIPAFVSKFPSNPESYILAFVANRKTCRDLFHTAKRSVFLESDGASVLIDAKLPKPQRDEFLSRLQG